LSSLFFFFLPEGSLSRERSKAVFTRLRDAQEVAETNRKESPDSSPHFKNSKSAAGWKEGKKGEKKQWHSLIHFLFPSKAQMVSVSIEGLG